MGEGDTGLGVMVGVVPGLVSKLSLDWWTELRGTEGEHVVRLALVEAVVKNEET